MSTEGKLWKAIDKIEELETELKKRKDVNKISKGAMFTALTNIRKITSKAQIERKHNIGTDSSDNDAYREIAAICDPILLKAQKKKRDIDE